MKLDDFTAFAPFDAMRKQIGTDRLRCFELFDPLVNLTGGERSELEQSEVLRSISVIRVLPDRTLALKDIRIIAYNPNENWYRQHRKYPTYHTAFCSQLEELRRTAADTEFLLTSRVAEDYDLVRIRNSGEVSLQSHEFVVCKHCLHTLRYKNYDEFRNRRLGYSQKVLGEFNLKEFYRLYPQYPLSFGSRPVENFDKSQFRDVE